MEHVTTGENALSITKWTNATQGRIQDFSYEECTTKEWRNWLVTQTNFKSEYEEEGFWPGNNIMWTAENTYHTYLHIFASP